MYLRDATSSKKDMQLSPSPNKKSESASASSGLRFVGTLPPESPNTCLEVLKNHFHGKDLFREGRHFTDSDKSGDRVHAGSPASHGGPSTIAHLDS